MLSTINLSHTRQTRQNTGIPAFGMHSQLRPPKTLPEKQRFLDSADAANKKGDLPTAEKLYKAVYDRAEKDILEREDITEFSGKEGLKTLIHTGNGLVNTLEKQAFGEKGQLKDIKKAVEAHSVMTGLSYYCGIIGNEDPSVAKEAKSSAREFEKKAEVLTRILII